MIIGGPILRYYRFLLCSDAANFSELFLSFSVIFLLPDFWWFIRHIETTKETFPNLNWYVGYFPCKSITTIIRLTDKFYISVCGNFLQVLTFTFSWICGSATNRKLPFLIRNRKGSFRYTLVFLENNEIL